MHYWSIVKTAPTHRYATVPFDAGTFSWEALRNLVDPLYWPWQFNCGGNCICRQRVIGQITWRVPSLSLLRALVCTLGKSWQSNGNHASVRSDGLQSGAHRRTDPLCRFLFLHVTMLGKSVTTISSPAPTLSCHISDVLSVYDLISLFPPKTTLTANSGDLIRCNIVVPFPIWP